MTTSPTEGVGADPNPSKSFVAERLSSHFCYATPQEFEGDQLLQGDVLKRTPALEQLLADVHPHFYRHNKNLFFMVLTQSCDLVRRGTELPNAIYVNIAPVRPIDEVVSREIASLELADIKGEVPLVTQKSRVKLTDFTRRLLNNNVPQYFYLEGVGTPIEQDCCAFLRLSIPIKTELHHQACLDAKILQLSDAFQAKLGSLIGQLYSRVGTKDWPTSELEVKVKSLLNVAAHWIDDAKVKHLRAEFVKFAAQDPNHVLSSTDIASILKAAPNTKKAVIERVLDIVASTISLDEAVKSKLDGRLRADPSLNKLLGS